MFFSVSFLAKAVALAVVATPCLSVEAAEATHFTYKTVMQYDYSQYPWHQSIDMLWKTKWDPLAKFGVYPFESWTNHSDFQSIFNTLTERYSNQTADDFDEDKWAQPFLGPAHAVLKLSEQQEKQGKRDVASKTYFRAASIYRMAYFPWYGPVSQSRLKAKAWSMEKKAYEAAMRLGKYHFESFSIPFTDAPSTALSQEIPLYITSPKTSSRSRSSRSKVVLMIAGLDHYRTGQLIDVASLVDQGYTVINIDMPGTGDAPITGEHIDDDAKLWKMTMDWIHAEAKGRRWNKDEIYAWGTSTGSYWAVKMSRSERKRLKGVLAQGTASHYTFQPDWLKSADRLAYPVALWSPLSKVFGYLDKHQFAKHSIQYSLKAQGVLDAKSAPLTLVNGMDDTVFPIDDSILLSTHGDGATLRLFPGSGHMGQPASGAFVEEFWKRLA